jgi:hypothetical protein
LEVCTVLVPEDIQAANLIFASIAMGPFLWYGFENNASMLGSSLCEFCLNS